MAIQNRKMPKTGLILENRHRPMTVTVCWHALNAAICRWKCQRSL